MLRVKRVTIILTLGVLAKRSRVHTCTRHLKSKGAIILGSGQGKKFEKETNRYDKSNARMPGCSSHEDCLPTLTTSLSILSVILEVLVWIVADIYLI
jgi:hypothetical protein